MKRGQNEDKRRFGKKWTWRFEKMAYSGREGQKSG